MKRILKAENPLDLEALKLTSDEVLATDDYQSIVKDLVDTLSQTSNGIAIAAPQIGVAKRIFVMNRGEIKNLVCINPKIISAVGRMKYDEGCLSFPDKYVRKVRKQFVKLKYLDENFVEREAQFSGVEAVCVQHECDHLNGKLLK